MTTGRFGATPMTLETSILETCVLGGFRISPILDTPKWFCPKGTNPWQGLRINFCLVWLSWGIQKLLKTEGFTKKDTDKNYTFLKSKCCSPKSQPAFTNLAG